MIFIGQSLKRGFSAASSACAGSFACTRADVFEIGLGLNLFDLVGGHETSLRILKTLSSSF